MKLWTKEEDDILIKNYHLGYKILINLLSDRTKKAIKHRINYLNKNGARLSYYDSWTKEEEEILLQNFNNNSVTKLWKNFLPEKTYGQVRAKINTFLKRNKITRRPEYKDWTNTKIGQLLVIGRTDNIFNEKGIRTITWNCLCSCGETVIRLSTVLNRGQRENHNMSCEACRCKNLINRYPDTEIQYYIFNRIQDGAIKRDLAFSITPQYIWDLFLKQDRKCALSGRILVLETSTKITSNATASLDRIDNTKGYIEGNVQWVHKNANWMKQDYTQEEYIEMCHDVSEYQKSIKSKLS